MRYKYSILNRIVALILAFSFVFPALPLKYIDFKLGTNFSKANILSTEVKALSYEITGETITTDVTTLAQIEEYMTTATNNPNNLYVLTYTGNNALAVTGTTTFATDGHIKIVRGSANAGRTQYLFNVTGILNIGSPNMKGTVEIDGGATYTLDSSMSYDFETERPTGNGGNGTLNTKTSGGTTYVLFNDGNSYADAHWYAVGGVTSNRGLITNTGTVNIYDNTRIGNVYISATLSDGNSGTINNPSGTVNMNGGEISWNAMGKANNGCGPAIYAGTPDSGSSTGANAKVYINGGIISNNTALDVSSCSADGGAVSVDRGKLYINGGKITNNRSATGGSDKNGDGGGVMGRIGAEIVMYGGEISNNFSGSFGGGILLWESSFHMYGGTITRNFARNGGGAGMSAREGSEIYLYNDATITDNYAEYGGGLCVGSNGFATNCKLVVLNGNITNNTATVMGGGICNYNQTNCACDLRGGDISNNHSAKGAGLAIVNQSTDSMDYLLYLSGGIVINTNNDIYISKLNSTTGDTVDNVDTSTLRNAGSGWSSNYVGEGTRTTEKTYQTPIKVIGRLTASGTVGMISMDDFSQYVGTTTGGTETGTYRYNSRNYTITYTVTSSNVLDMIKFERADGGSLEVQNNKFSLDTNQYILEEYISTNSLRLTELSDSSDATYVVRNGDTLYASINDAVEAAQDGDTLYIINNLTITETINVNKNIIIVPETSFTKNDSNVLDGDFKNPSGTKLPNFTYQPAGDYTISLSSDFGDTSSNTAGFVIENGYTLTLGNQNYTNENDVSISNGGFLVFDGNSGHPVNKALFEVKIGGTLKAYAGMGITNNATKDDISGAGVLVDGTFILNGATIKNNVSQLDGAGVYVNGTMQLLNGTIETNTASRNGAGVFVANGGNLSVSSGYIVSNTARQNGAGIYLENGATCTINDGEINSNIATQNGAGIYVEDGATLTVNDGRIRSNQTTNGNGAGIYNLGEANLKGGIVSDNKISSYNTNPLGQGIYQAGNLIVSDAIKVTMDNPVYLTSGKVVEIKDYLTNANAIAVKTQDTEIGTKVAHIKPTDASMVSELANSALSNRYVYEINNKKIVVEDDEYLAYGTIRVSYSANNATSGTVPIDDNDYSGGDNVSIKLNNTGDDELKRNSYVFMGWSTVESSPVTSGVIEISLPIYYPSELIPGVAYQNNLKIFQNTTLYAVWAIDANNNGTPDYREDMYTITVVQSEHGTVSANVSEAQAGTLIMINTTQDDGYEVRTIEVTYELNGVTETMSLENGRVVRLTDNYFYFNMPLTDATVYTTFGEQSKNAVRVIWLDNSNNESIEEFVNLQLAINKMKENMEAGTYRPKRATLLRYTYSQTDIDVFDGLSFDFDLAGFTLDMNNHNFTIENGSTVRIIDNMTGGKILFNSSGGSNGTANNLVNNGNLAITNGTITMDAGENAAEKLIVNNGNLTISSGSVKHNGNNGIAIYNDGYLVATGGNINGKKYGIYHANTEDAVDASTDVVNMTHTFELSGFGGESAYGVNKAHYISSIYVAKGAHIDFASILDNCSQDNIVKEENKIKLYLDSEIGLNEPFLTSGRLAFMMEHFRMHFDLQDRDGYEIAINSSKYGVLIKELSTLKTVAVPENAIYSYRSPITLKATLFGNDGLPYIGADGKVYFFVFDRLEAVGEWAKIWNESTHDFNLKDEDDPSQGSYGIQDATGFVDIDPATGEAIYTFSAPVLGLGHYAIYAIFVGEDTYGSYSNAGEASYGYVGPIVSNQMGSFVVEAKSLQDASITINTTTESNYNGFEQSITVEVIDNGLTLVEGTDYDISISGQLIDAGTYDVVISGTADGNYKDSVTKQYVINPYNDSIVINGVEVRYLEGTVPNISFDGESPTASVTDIYGNVLEYGSDYSIKYYEYDSLSDSYSEINSLPSTAGVYKIVASGNDGGNYASTVEGEAAFIISVDENAKYSVSIQNESLIYNGVERTVAELGTIEVTNTDTGMVLVRDRDYVVTFGISRVKNADNYTLIIKGLNDYESLSIAESVSILKKPMDDTTTTITFENDNYYYTGRSQVPAISSISVDGVNTDASLGGTPLVAGVDYVTSINGDNINVGTATFVITALNGNYTGSIEHEFQILPRDIDSQEVSVSIYQAGFTGAEIIPTITVTDSISGTTKVLASGLNQDYVVSYRPNSAANDGASLSPNGYPINKGTYDVVIEGQVNYTGQRIETFVVGNYKGRIIAQLDPNVYTYAGNASTLEGTIVSALTVERGTDGRKLEYSTDYKLAYNTPENTEAPSEVGEYILYVVGVGNYDGTQDTVNFTISPLTGSIHLELENSELVYNAKVQYPSIKKDSSYLSLNGEKVYLSDLRENDDYIVIYNENSKNIGGYMLQVNGVGTYAGNYNFANYQIVAKSLNSSDIQIQSSGVVSKLYNGQEQELNISASGDIWVEYNIGNDEVVLLEEGVDFTTLYTNNTDSGIASLVLVGKGNYSNAKAYTYTIEKRNFGNGTIDDNYTLTGVENKDYTGLATSQTITLHDTDLNTNLVEGKDFEIVYENNIDVGNASFTVNGLGNYSGTINGTYEVLMNHTISITGNDTYQFNKEPINSIITVTDSLGHILGGTDYELTYYVDSECTTKTNSENSGATEEGKEPVNVGTYYRKVVGTSTNYAGLEATQEITIVETKDYTVNMSISNTNYDYDGEIHSATIVLKDSDGAILSGDNYSVTYYKDSEFTATTSTDDGATVNGGAPRNAGNYYVRVVGLGDYESYDSHSTFIINPLRIQNMDIEAVSDVTYTGSAHTPTPTVSWQKGGETITLQNGTDYEYEYQNNTNVGLAIVIVKAKETSRNYAGSATIPFNILSAQDINVTLENPEVEYNSEVQKPELSEIFVGEKSIEQLNLEGASYEVDYGTGDYKTPGSYELVVKNTNEGVVLQQNSVNYTIKNKALVVTPNSNQSKIYGTQGNAFTFTTNIATTSGLYGEDKFTGQLARAVGDNVGEYEITIGSLQAVNYDITFTSGEKYKITPKDIGDSEVTISGVETEYTYNGSTITPNVRITYASATGRLALEDGTDYDVAGYEKYDSSNNSWSSVASAKEVGKYRITLQGKGNYKGIESVTFDITAMKAFNASFSDVSKEYNRNTQNPTVKVTSTTGTLVENTDYALVYYLDNTYSQKTNIGDHSGARTEGGAPVNVGNYYLRVEGIANYLGCVAESEFRITAKNIQDKTNSTDYDISILDVLDQTYTGREITPEPTISWNGIVLTKGTDYTLSYANNVNAGVATITVTGAGNYVGTRTITFNIVANSSGEIVVRFEDANGDVVDETNSSYTYDGLSHIPEATVSLVIDGQTTELVNGEDYNITYGDTINAGLVSAQVVLTGNYAGSIEEKYLISPRNLSETTITVTPEIATFNGEEQKPEVEITYNNMLLDEGTDYQLTFGEGNFINKGSYNLVISALNNNYTGEITKGFSIEPYGSVEFETLRIDYVGDKSSYLDTEFSETLLKSNLIVKDIDGNVLRESEYDVEFKKESDSTYQATASTQVGKYMIKVTGKDDTNYEGTYAIGERGYVIYTDSLSADLISINYDGLTHSIENTDVVVKSAGGETLSTEDYDVSFGSVEVKKVGNYTIFITGKNDFDGATGSSTYRINPAEFTLGTVASKEYDGQAEDITLNVIGINNSAINLGRDYEVTYTGTTEAGSYYSSNKVPKQAGEYTITVVGRGNYFGCEKETAYVITPKSLQDPEITMSILNNMAVYNGLTRQANVELRYDISDISLKLYADVDYEVTSATEFKDAGEYTITASAKEGNYKDSASATYTIVPYTGKLQTSMSATVFNYGTALDNIKNALTVKFNNETLTSDMYDIVAYPAVSSIPEVGNYTFTITANTSNYVDGDNKANAEVKFAIVPASELQISFTDDTVTYNGEVQKPSSGDIFIGDKSVSEWAEEGKVYEIDYGEGNYKDAASYMIQAIYKENNILIEQNIGTYTIENANVIVTPDSGLYKEYGTLDTEITYTTNITSGTHGLYGDDEFSEELVRVQGENVGLYEIKQNGIYATNYNIEVATGVKYEIKPKNISSQNIEITGINSAYTFTGTTIKPSVMATYNSEKFGNLALVQDQDFRVKYQKYDASSEDYTDITSDNDLVNVGRYKVVVTGIGNYTGTYEKEFEISSYVTSFVAIVSNNNKTYNKQVQKATVEVTGASSTLVEGVDYRVVYYTNNSYTTKTNTTRELGGAEEEGGAPRNAGNYYIGVEGIGNYTGSSSRATFVINPKPIISQEIQFTPISAQTYTGSNIEPRVILAWGVGLVEDRDFEVSYSNNTNIGTANITINGIGNYSETRSESFEIVPISDGEIDIVLSEDSYVYDGTAKEPEVTVNYTIDGNVTTLQEETDYDVSYSNNVDSGTATVTVTLTGVYNGTKTENYEITPYDLENATLTIIPSSNSYNGKNQSVSISVNALDKLLVQGVDYTSSIPTSMKNAGEYTITVTGVEDSNYTGTKAGSFTINKYGLEEDDTLLLEFANEISSYKEGITKAEFESNLVVKDLNRNTLVNSDYTITYSNDGETFTTTFPEGAGTYTVKVTGTGTNYAGQYDIATRKFNIHVDKVDLTDVTRVYKNGIYTIAEILDDITITSDVGTELPKGSFDITFGKENPTNVGSYTILVQGKTNTEYYGISGAGTFTITQANITLNSASDVTYTGASVEPTLDIAGVNSEEVQLGKDYEITYTGNDVAGNVYNSSTAPTKVGSYTVTIRGNGNYQGTSSKDYQVKAVNMSATSFRVEVTNNKTVYNTAVQNPQVVVYYDASNGTIKLTEGVDYELDNGTNTYKNARTYNFKVKALATSNYTGNKDVSYTIKPYTGTLDVSLSKNSFEIGAREDIVLNNAIVKYLNETIPLSNLDIVFTPQTLIQGNYTIQFSARSDMKNYYLSATNKASGYAFFTIEEAEEIVVTLDEDTHVYTAKPITISEDNIKINGKAVSTLRRENPDITYEVEWSDTLKDVGNYTVTVKVLKNDKVLQQAMATYKITQKDISESDVTVQEILSQTYTGAEIIPETKFTYNEVLLTTEDYTAVYKDNKNVGEATITIVGIGNYKGTREVKFDILEASNLNPTITLLEAGETVTNSTYTYDGSNKIPQVKVEATISGEQITLVENESYVVTFGDTINAGTVSTLITFIGNYSGNASTSYVINPRNISETTVEQNPVYSVYTRKVIKPSFTLTYNDLLLKESRDYTIDYGTENYKDVGVYEIKLNATTGNYTGSLTKNFEITKYGADSNEYLTFEIDGDTTFINTEFNKEQFESTFIVKDLNGNTLTPDEYTVTYANVDDMEFTDTPSTAIGTYVVKVEGKGNYDNTYAKATRDYVLCTQKLLVDNIEVVYDGNVKEIQASDVVVKTSSGTTLEVSQYDVSFGSGTVKNAGDYTLIVSGKAQASGAMGTATYKVKPTTFTLEDIEAGTYNGVRNIPEVIAKGINDTTLVENVDYSLSYTGTTVKGTTYESYEAPIDAGEYEVVATGKGNYSGTISKEYIVEKASIQDAAITLYKAELTYNGNSQVPTEVVTYTSSGRKQALTSPEDYEIKYMKKTDSSYEEISKSQSKDVGEYKVVITGKGNFEDAKELEYAITSHSVGLHVDYSNTTVTYNKQAQEAEITVTGMGEELSEDEDYEINYFVDSACTELTTEQNSGSASNGGAPVNSGVYYVKVSGLGNYEGSESKSQFTINAKEITSSDISFNSISTQTYTGSEVKPEVKAEWGTYTLVEDTDYEVTYIDNIALGTATIQIKGIGNYTGTKNITFTITAISEGEIEIELYEDDELVDDETYTYDGSAKTPTVKVTYSSDENEAVLREGTDYNLTYVDNVESGTAKVQIMLKGNYTGSEEKEFVINKFDLTNATIELSDDVTYTNKVQKPSVQVKQGNMLLAQGKDYEVTYSGDFVNAGEYDVVAKAMSNSNYKGSNKAVFTINKYGIETEDKLTLEFADGTSSYVEQTSKEDFEENLVVKDLNRNELSEDDYTITYSEDGTTYTDEFPQDAGIYSVKVTGKGNNYASQNDVAVRDFVIFIEAVDANDVTKDYKNEVFTISDISGDIVLNSDLGTELDKSKFDISFGKSTPKEVGTYTIVIAGKAGDVYEGLLGTAEFTIKSAEEFEVEDVDDVQYTGTAPKIDIEATGVNDEALTQGKDYEVTYKGTDLDGNTYEGNVPPTKVGEYEVVITGKGNYDGAEVTKQFEITAVDSSDVDATLVQTQLTFNGEGQVPEEVVKYVTDENTIMLTKDVDYTVSYENADGTVISKEHSKDAGDYKVVITLKGSYDGTIKLDYEITTYASGFNVTIKDSNKEYNREAQEVDIDVKDTNGEALEEDKDFEIIYYKDAEFTEPTDAETGAEEDGGAPSESGKYYVLVKGIGNFEGATSSTTFTISKKSIDDLTIADIEDQLYDGSKKEPEVIVKDGSTVISEDEYEITYRNNTEVGTDTASVTITMKDNSNYKGSKTVDFSIVVNSDEEIEMTLVDENGDEVTNKTYTYDSSSKKPKAIVKVAGKTLEEGKDYEVKYLNNKSAGTATVSVTLKGNYAGTETKEFTINELDLADSKVTLKPEKITYTGKEQLPEVEVTYETEDNKFVKLSAEEYEVVYPDKSKDAGEYTITVKAKSDNIKGSIDATYTIVRTSSGGGGGSTKTETKVIVVAPSGDEDNSLLDKVNHNSYIKGYDDGTFKPDKIMTRAEVVTIFTRLLKDTPKVDTKKNPFVDIDNHWAKDAILTMSSLGIVKGYEDRTFKPGNKITRAEFATMISRFEKIQKLEINTNFYDVGEDHWAYDTINYARYMGWISGYQDGSFRPNNSITRAEAITVINRILGRNGDVDKINSNRSLNVFTDIEGHWAYYGIIEATNSHEYEIKNKVEIWK